MSEPILSARDLRKVYRLGKHEVAVLKGVNLDVKPGEVLVIVGASGAGKTPPNVAMTWADTAIVTRSRVVR